MKKPVLIAAVFGLLFACSDDDGAKDVICTEEFVAGLVVTVKDADTGEVLEDGVVVTATDGNYTEDLETIPQTTGFYGAYERRGNYIITVAKKGYADYTSDTIEVDADRCHVITEQVTVELQPE